jgi:hypothetical protein
LASNSYSYGMVDTLLAAKQNSLSVSSVTGSSLLSGTVLKRLDFDTGDFSVSDSGHALNVSITGKQDSISASPGSGEGERIDLWNSSAGYVRCLEFFPSNVFSTLTGSDNINVSLDLSAYALTSSVTLLLSQNASAAVTARNALYLDALAADDAHAYSKSVSDGRYWQQGADLLQLDHNTDTRYLRFSASHGGNVQQRYAGGSMLIRRVNNSGASATVLTFSSTNQNVTCAGSFSSNSDRVLKDNETPITVAEAGLIIDTVEAKKYTRNDTGEDRHGFIAQDLEAACTGNFAHIVGSTPATDDEGEEIEGEAIKTVDYSRLVALLWTTVKDLRSRVLELENAQL